MTIAKTSAYLNALREEGSRDDLLREVGRLFDDRERLRAEVSFYQDLSNQLRDENARLLRAVTTTSQSDNEQQRMNR